MSSEPSQHARFLRMYTKVQPRVFAFILSVIHNRSDADELFQETNVILWERFDQYREETPFAAWAIGIARNKVLEYLRKNKQSRMLFADRFYEQIAEASANSEDDLTGRMSALKFCLEKLKSPDRKLLSLRFNRDYTVKMLSQLTGRSTDSLYKSMARIMHLLKGCIERKLVRQQYE